MILEVEFKKLDKALCMRVLRQSRRGWDCYSNSKFGLDIFSLEYPQLTPNTVLVRGADVKSDRQWSKPLHFTSNKARDAYHRKALRAIARARKEIK